MFGLLDGWGPYTPANYSITRSLQGKARILAWRSIGKTVMETKKPYGDGASNEDYDIPINREDITNEIVVSVEVISLFVISVNVSIGYKHINVLVY